MFLMASRPVRFPSPGPKFLLNLHGRNFPWNSAARSVSTRNFGALMASPIFRTPNPPRSRSSGFGQEQQMVEFAGAAQPLCSVDHHAFAVDILRHVADEKCREICQLEVLPEAFHRMLVPGVFFKLL